MAAVIFRLPYSEEKIRHLPVGTELFWAMREPEGAAREWHDLLRNTVATPQCGLLFNCLSRGAGFYGGQDKDWQQVRERFPRMPFAGFYGNGEIAWRAQDNRLLQYASVLALMGESSNVHALA